MAVDEHVAARAAAELRAGEGEEGSVALVVEAARVGGVALLLELAPRAGVACFLRSLCATSSLQPACMQRTYIWPSPRADSTYLRTQPLHALCSRLHVGCPVFSGLNAGSGTSS